MPNKKLDAMKMTVCKVDEEITIATLEAFCPVGSSFRYLGIEFLVVAIGGRGDSIILANEGTPVIITNRFNRVSGMIVVDTFVEHELPALLKAATPLLSENPVIPQPSPSK